ncbi:MAG: GGDEF domain-containing phosphodiesterase [Treponema sp.]|nr:GGDEF domain-containing phosphodiesterase [Treponema sp.]
MNKRIHLTPFTAKIISFFLITILTCSLVAIISSIINKKTTELTKENQQDICIHMASGLASTLYSEKKIHEKLKYTEDSENADNSIDGLSIEHINIILQEIDLGPMDHLILTDDQNHKFIYKNDVNSIISDKDIDLSKMKSDNEYVTFDKYGSYYICRRQIRDTNCTIYLVYSQPVLNQLLPIRTSHSFLIISLTIIFIIILLSMENLIMDIFQKNQMIASVYDPLTNLWTRQKFESEAGKELKRNRQGKFILIETDIRGFKFINQNYGEEAADKLLQYYAKKLSEKTQKYKALIGHGFADHFYILLKISSVHTAMIVFKEQLSILNQEIKDYEIPFFPKFGISFFMGKTREKEATIQNLIGQASFAKSTIKDTALNQYSIYNSKLLKRINEERYIESHSETALENNEFFVMYQPKVLLNSEKIGGAEALVRWNNPEMGIMNPDQFIPLFEKNGFIKKLDFYVYEQVFKFIQKQIDSGGNIVPISVNMSRNHDKPEKFLHDFMQMFNKYSIPKNLIEIEILERSVMNNNTLREFTDLLHKEGFTVAMDDFGSGESSLNMLTKIPVDVLKFDRTFLSSSTTENGNLDPSSADFIKILVDLSKNLKKHTIFEGVETQGQRDFLKSINCDQVQGYFYSKPLFEQEFINFLSTHPKID